MKRIAIICLLFFCCLSVNASHLKGGWIFYEYLGDGAAPNTSKYRITVNQYLLCSSSGGQIDANVFLGVFNASNNQLIQEFTIAQTSTIFEKKISFDPCISNPPQVCYRIDKYVKIIELPDNNPGYNLAVQRCCRIGGIVNVNNSDNFGITYTTQIPGVIQAIVVRNNNSPLFAQKDTAIVCVNSFFTFDFSALDNDGDSLSYVFCNGLTGGSTTISQPDPPSNPPYNALNYAIGYSGQSPMGSNVAIDPLTGIISGIAPVKTGDYVVAVCAQEFRNGIYIGQSKKEIHINVANCQLAGAQLKPNYLTCNGFSFTFENESSASNIIGYHWDFGVKSIDSDTSNLPKPTYTFPDTGKYTIKLSVVNLAGCRDSTISVIKVYPGFFPGFSTVGSCFLNPFVFTDTSRTNYGVIDSWKWDFGDPGTTTDISSLQNPSYTYLSAGVHNVSLTITNSNGCVDTVIAPVTAYDKPIIALPFRDTLICSGDTLHLQAVAGGIAPNYLWSPPININNTNIADPLVFPVITTTYLLSVDDKGCTNTDSVKVNVVKAITVKIGLGDTTVCSTDTIQLNVNTSAIAPVFKWLPATDISNTKIANPLVYPQTTTTYYIKVDDQVCSAIDSIKVAVVKAISVSIVTNDTTLCSTDTLQLNTTTSAITPIYQWLPAIDISNQNIANPKVFPQTTTTYFLKVRDQVCLTTDSVKVNVVKAITANITINDTTLCSTDTLQLNVSTSALSPVYQWLPATSISNQNIANPLVYPQAATTYLLLVKDQVCAAADSIIVDVVKEITTSIGIRDTTVCISDTLDVQATSTAISPVYTWIPTTNISDPSISNPRLYPQDTTTYILRVDDRACSATDTLIVNVVKSLSIKINNDTSICRGDTIQLTTVSNGITFLWTPALGLSDPTVKDPLAFPATTTNYQLAGSVGKCLLSGSINIKVGPYPLAFAGVDTIICYGNSTQLNANISGQLYTWTPSNNLLNPNTLNPIAGPQTTTNYILQVNDTLGCPKPAYDSILVKVIPAMTAFAGRDTNIVAFQPLQLIATGGTDYTWSPNTGLNNANIYNPIAILNLFVDNITYRVKAISPEGCIGYDDIKVTVYKTLPEIFIPTGFTPNSDGLNDILKPILAGIKTLNFFRVFNRWGQLIFSTSEVGKGWDGTMNGAKQPSGTYIFEAQAIDYKGNSVYKKGTVVLVR